MFTSLFVGRDSSKANAHKLERCIVGISHIRLPLTRQMEAPTLGRKEKTTLKQYPPREADS